LSQNLCRYPYALTAALFERLFYFYSTITSNFHSQAVVNRSRSFFVSLFIRDFLKNPAIYAGKGVRAYRKEVKNESLVYVKNQT
jgi:hypothetical protein